MMASPGRREFMLSNDACIRFERPLYLVRRFAVLTGQHTHDLERWQDLGQFAGLGAERRDPRSARHLRTKHMDGAGAEVSFCREK